MFGLFKKKQQPLGPDGVMVIARLNARCQPMDRGEYFEDPLGERLEALGLGQVTGGGTQLADEPAGIEFCDLEIIVNAADADTLQAITAELERLGAPLGSRLFVEERDGEIPFGAAQGLGLFLNGTELPDEVYQSSDVNHVIAECDRLLDGQGRMMGYWQGAAETALYFYGASFDEMQARIEAFRADYPLCAKSRIERIA